MNTTTEQKEWNELALSHAKHTPGNWEHYHNGFYFEILTDYRKEPFNLYLPSIQVMHSEAGDNTEGYRPSKEEAESNAKLIVAAPKLHEWAIKRVDWLQGFYDQDPLLLSPDGRKELAELKEIIKQLA